MRSVWDRLHTIHAFACKYTHMHTLPSHLLIQNLHIVLPPTSTVPSQARSVTITRVLQDGVELNWLPPTEPNGEVHYVIEYKREDSGKWASVNTTSDSTHYNLTGLHCGTNYTIRVATMNSAGRTSFMPTVKFTCSTAPPTPNNTPGAKTSGWQLVAHVLEEVYNVILYEEE